MKRSVEIINEKEVTDDLITRIKEFGCSKITVMFDEINYLFFDYPYTDNNMRNVLTIENSIGDILYVRGYNSGYGGTGPNKTRGLLTRLDVPDETAKRLMYCNGFQISFDKEGTYQPREERAGFLFENREHELKARNIFVDYDRMTVNLSKKQLYFIEPFNETYRSLLQALDCITIDKMYYYIGEESHKHYTFDLPQWRGQYKQTGLYRNHVNRIINGSFVRFTGKPFDIICFLGEDAPASYINTLSMYLRKIPVFYESEMNSKQVLLTYTPNYRKTKYSKIMSFSNFLRKKEEIYGSLNINREHPVRKWYLEKSFLW